MTAGWRARVLSVDTALGVVVAVLTLASTRFADYEPPGVGEEAQGPWRHGPPMSREAEPVLPIETVAWPVLPAALLLAPGVALRRLYPRISYLAVVGAVAVFLASGGPYGPVLIAPVLAVHGLAVGLPLRRWLPWLVALPVMLSAGFWRQPYAGLLDPGLYAAVIFGSAVIVSPALFALIRRGRQEAEARDRVAERERDLYEERLRMAREVHDVVGHSLSVINLQAGVALHVLDRKPEQAGAALEAIRTSSKEALEELRHTLGMFRDTGQRTSTDAGLDRLPDLVSAVRGAGRSVEVRLSEEVRSAVPGPVGHTAFRIVQEALTNVVRHAPGASAVIDISRDESALRVQVSNDGPRLEVADLRPGNGIRGMVERAAAVGGRLEVRPRSAGGVLVLAELPITPMQRVA